MVQSRVVHQHREGEQAAALLHQSGRSHAQVRLVYTWESKSKTSSLKHVLCSFTQTHVFQTRRYFRCLLRVVFLV